MAHSIEEMKSTVAEELRVLDDDIHATGDGITFYLPPKDLDKAKEKLDADLKILEKYEHEYLIKAACL